MIQFDMQYDLVLKKMDFDLLDSSPWWDRSRGSGGKIFATVLVH